MNLSVLYALAAAALFGASTPLAKLLGVDVAPMLLAGLLYLSSGVGLAIVRFARDRGWQRTGLTVREWPWLMGAILFGGVLAPVALMFGLTRTAGATASLMLNLESVLTALLAWVVFRENADRRIVIGMIAIVLGGIVLSWPHQSATAHDWTGPLAVAFACLCWAIDNNLTRKVSASDALFIAGSKGLAAGVVNTSLALAIGAQLPAVTTLSPILLVGFLGYGVSLVLFVLALRGLGSARTGAYFSTAPFLGAVISILILGEPVSLWFLVAATLMAIGVLIHLMENHAHEHQHEPLAHNHRHRHDEHHQHEHGFEWDGSAPHSHPHEHAPIRHSHAHFPDIHHRHKH
ncbi:Permease of the drug/metabolite transporter (DMT) superfamily [Pseudomonas sp. NFPP10]|uniref:DMT family transporter n=1 Tax=unclassified Pseudomonas TaxID=196821 RepID=UPI000888EA44|nr:MULTISPECIES: DMT family transporter [unclassified Pseudomonas]PZP07713.1 MAG: EamA family transporter [Pseudomonas protegens]SDA32277.1 Permease of the drug/metabolite transporter (DMT) superfamily [Pseudomonas sp. NFPP12]SEM33237.1 Permease of the drug/metabolite transporter (DMT) superfamily [Pseudomonas sp. NFPP10]SFK13313.1 Permease of the drug/metabolite transporter (DMT) superfamily [Pseudomonas sp. NFPP08]SFN30201.1 Permease of the drug/metabolite transporter (DMT) superfamily [Pseu